MRRAASSAIVAARCVTACHGHARGPKIPALGTIIPKWSMHVGPQTYPILTLKRIDSSAQPQALDFPPRLHSSVLLTQTQPRLINHLVFVLENLKL